METNRLIIDNLREEDKIDYFKNISNDKLVLETFICKYTDKIEDLEFEKYLKINNLFAIRTKENKKLIGIILICEEFDDACEIGYGIGSNYWNNGYASEATKCFIDYCINEMGFKKVYASFFKGNIASKRVMEKCNMKYSHIVENELEYLGKKRDLIYYVIEK